MSQSDSNYSLFLNFSLTLVHSTIDTNCMTPAIYQILSTEKAKSTSSEHRTENRSQKETEAEKKRRPREEFNRLIIHLFMLILNSLLHFSSSFLPITIVEGLLVALKSREEFSMTRPASYTATQPDYYISHRNRFKINLLHVK